MLSPHIFSCCTSNKKSYVQHFFLSFFLVYLLLSFFLLNLKDCRLAWIKKDNCDPYQFPATHKSNDISQTFKKVNSLFFAASIWVLMNTFLFNRITCTVHLCVLLSFFKSICMEHFRVSSYLCRIIVRFMLRQSHLLVSFSLTKLENILLKPIVLQKMNPDKDLFQRIDQNFHKGHLSEYLFTFVLLLPFVCQSSKTIWWLRSGQKVWFVKSFDKIYFFHRHIILRIPFALM